MDNIEEKKLVNEYRSLDYFLKVGYFPYNISKTQINFERGFFLGIDECYPIHLAGNIVNQSLEETYYAIKKYIEKSLDILVLYNGIYEEQDSLNKIQFDTDHENLYAIKEKLGKPPLFCKPLYIMTVEQNGIEEVVYIGKTNSFSSRFSNGHAAITKLHDPKFEGVKRIYLATVMFLSENEYIPLEFLDDFKEIKDLLIAIEGTLINSIKPVLNIQNIDRTMHHIGSQVHIQNFVRKVLNDKFFYLD